MEGENNPIVKGPDWSMLDEILQTFLNITRIFLFPSFLIGNELLVTYIPTLEDRKNGEISTRTKTLYTVMYLFLMIWTLPLVLIFVPLRLILLSLRKPYHYSVKHTAFNGELGRSHNEQNALGSREFRVATMNILLLPEYTSRYNNMKNVKWRSREVGERIINDQSPQQNQPTPSKDTTNAEHLRNRSFSSNDKEVEGNIKTRFSDLDFLCIQEAFSNYHVKTLKKELHKVFPYIVSDVAVHSLNINKFIYNSGLMIASRHPIAVIDFKPFTDFMWPGSIMSKGMLMVKVVVPSQNSDVLESQRVGYIFDVHLQAYEKESGIISKQLDEIIKWSNEFMLRTRNPGDQEMFSILCGDFNSDNLSPGDRKNANHEFFKLFKDYGRVAAGEEKAWTVGTEMRHKNMSDPRVSTPEGLKMAMEDPSLRRQYIGDANLEVSNEESIIDKEPPTDESGRVIPSSFGGKRRVDLITFHSKYPVKVKSYEFITRLAALTDHIPVQISFTCNLSSRSENDTTQSH